MLRSLALLASVTYHSICKAKHMHTRGNRLTRLACVWCRVIMCMVPLLCISMELVVMRRTTAVDHGGGPRRRTSRHDVAWCCQRRLRTCWCSFAA